MVLSSGEEELECPHAAGGRGNGATTVETISTVSIQLNTSLPYELAIPLVGIYLRKKESLCHIKT